MIAHISLQWNYFGSVDTSLTLEGDVSDLADQVATSISEHLDWALQYLSSKWIDHDKIAIANSRVSIDDCEPGLAKKFVGALLKEYPQFFAYFSLSGNEISWKYAKKKYNYLYFQKNDSDWEAMEPSFSQIP